MTTRWGSYLLPGPPYIGDIALAGLVGHRLWTLLRHHTPTPILGKAATTSAVLLLIFATITLALGELSTDALRDGAPYFYAVLVLFGQSYSDTSSRTIEVLVYGALILHAAWYSIAEFLPSLVTVATLGDGSVLIFGGRADIDGAMLGVLIALALDRTVLGRTPLLGAAVASWALTLVLLTQARSSFLATVVLIGFVALRHAVIWHSRRRERTGESAEPARTSLLSARNSALAVAVVVFVPLALTAISGVPDALERSVNVAAYLDDGESEEPEEGGGSGNGDGGGSGSGDGEGSGGSDEDGDSGKPADSGVGTAFARTAGWEAVVDWIPEDGPSRVVVGAGFGPHYMQLSGADVAFLGPAADPSVRSIHNFGLNTWARLGLVGLVLVGIIVALGIIAAVRLSTRDLTPPLLDLFASLLVVAIPLIAFLGVVLESPFGAIPYFWAIGYLSARMVEVGLWKPMALPARLRGAAD